MAKSETFNTGYFSLSTQNEHLFLSVTPSCKHGPGIKRDGVTSPRMKDPHSIPEVTINSPLGRVPETHWMSLNDTTNAFEQRAGTWTIYHHLKEFCQVKGDEWQIIGAQGCGDLTMNPWHIAYLGRSSYIDALHNTVCGILINDEYTEPIEKRVYRCLVKWNEDAVKQIGRQYEFLDLRFINLNPIVILINAPELAQEYENCLKGLPDYNEDLKNISPFLEFALAGKEIIQKGHQVPLVTAIDKFQDVRHIFKLPHQVRCSGNFRGQTIQQINLGEYQLYGDLNARRAALNGPIIIETDLNQAGGFFRINLDELQEDLNHKNFKLVSESPSRVGDYYLHSDDKIVEIYFPKNVYPFGILGMHNNEIICLSSSGLSGRIGNTLEGITRIMIDGFNSEEAIVLDEGFDVFQLVNPTVSDENNSSFRYTNEQLLDKILAFTYGQIQNEKTESLKNPINGGHLGGNMTQWPLNLDLLGQVEETWHSKKLSRLDYSDIFPVRPGRSQIRSILIFAVRK